MSRISLVKCSIPTCSSEERESLGGVRGWLEVMGPERQLVDLCPGHANQYRAFLRGKGSETAFELMQALYRRAARGDQAAYEAFETLRHEVDVMTAALGTHTRGAMQIAEITHANLQRLALSGRFSAYVGRVMPNARR